MFCSLLQKRIVGATRLRDVSGSASRPGSAPGSALGAEPPENQFAFAKNPLTERPRRGPGHVIPLQVLYMAAVIADEMVMRHAFRIESRGAALDRHFTHQT